MTTSWMLVSDLDGTLLGDTEALARFKAWRKRRGATWQLVYATGRTCDDVAELIARGDLPCPTYTLGALGTESYHHATRQRTVLKAPPDSQCWDVLRVPFVVMKNSRAELQPAEFQSQLKVSFFLACATAAELGAIRSALSRAGIQSELIYSGNHFLDILPRGTHKGSATKLLARQLGVPAGQVIACGDSNNDLSLYRQGFRGVLVGNAEESLRRCAPSCAYRSMRPYADGVLDGIRHWTKRVPCDTSSSPESPCRLADDPGPIRGDQRTMVPNAGRDMPE